MSYYKDEKKGLKHIVLNTYKIIKDMFLILGIICLGYGFWLGYELVYKNRENLKIVERSITELGTGISLDNQRKAKIQKATEMILSRNSKLKYEVAMNYAEYFVDEADKYPNVDFVLLVSIASQESAFNDMAKSATGALGIMQIMPTTAMDMCEYMRMSYNDSLLYDAKYNIRLGARYVNHLMTYFSDVESVVAAYNAGPSGGSRYKMFKNGTLVSDFVSKETINYVPAVMNFKKQYEKMLH